jgi:hypothetical protein
MRVVREPEVLAILVLLCPIVNLTRMPKRGLCVAQRIVASVARRRAREGKSTVFRRPSLAAEELNMKVVYARCAGMDVHKKTVNVCIRRGKGNKLELRLCLGRSLKT